MILSRAYHQAKFDIAVSEGSTRICYVLIPEGVVDDMSRWAGKAAQELQCSIALVSGMDWNRDMTPWSAEGVMKKEKGFGGGAAMFLSELLNDFVPNVEQWLKIKNPKRYLLGISLSGLFSVWTLSKTNAFAGVGSVSGSLWYDNFTGWLSRTDLLSSARVYLSLGLKEKNISDRRMARVEDCSREALAILEGKGLDAVLEMVPGTHFSPLAPKAGRALEWLLADGSDGANGDSSI